MFRLGAVLAVLPLPLLSLSAPALATTVRVPQDFWTIQAAVNASGPGDTVLVASWDYPEYVTVQLADVTIRGASGNPADVVVEGFLIRNTSGVRLEDLTVAHPYSRLHIDDSDDVVLSGVALAVTQVELGDHYSTNQFGSVTFEDCDFGATRLEVFPGPFTCTVRSSRFGPKSLLGNGGAIWVGNGSSLAVEGCVFREIQVSGDGGAIFCDTGSDVVIDRCTFVRNWTSGSGGAIAVADATVLVSNSILFGSIQGEGIACIGSAGGVTVSHCLLFGNAHGDAPCGTDGGNLVLDPALCNPLDPAGLGLCANSPALAASPDNPWGEDIGALGQECTCTVAVETASWGRIKGMYR